MAKFVPTRRREVSKEATTGITKILKDGIDHIIIPSYLAEGKTTVIRMLPSFDENGREELALNPEGTVDEISGSLGRCFFPVEVASIFKNGLNVFISEVQPVDKNGNPVNNWRSPCETLTKTLGYKLWEQTQKQQKGQPTDIPEHWFQWAAKQILKHPQPTFLIQCMAQKVNGEERRNMRGQPEWIGPAVFMLPRSAETQFIQTILTREDNDLPLSMDNNLMGDFCSCENGHMLYLNKSRNQASKSDKGGISYQLTLGKKAVPFPADKASQLWTPWDNLIEIPFVEDAMAVLCEIFEPKAIDFVFKHSHYAAYIPEEMRGAADDIAKAEDSNVVKALPVISRASASQRNPHPASKTRTVEYKEEDVGGKEEDIPQLHTARTRRPPAEPEDDNLDYGESETSLDLDDMPEPDANIKDQFNSYLQELRSKKMNK